MQVELCNPAIMLPHEVHESDEPLQEVVRCQVTCYQTAAQYWPCLTMQVCHCNTIIHVVYTACPEKTWAILMKFGTRIPE